MLGGGNDFIEAIEDLLNHPMFAAKDFGWFHVGNLNGLDQKRVDVRQQLLFCMVVFSGFNRWFATLPGSLSWVGTDRRADRD